MILKNLSYIITTKNKINYLPIVINNLTKNIQPDEEIVVVDANSSDGTKEYLISLYNNGIIQKFISEPDHAQAHGCNKALLMAEGKLLKIINDDDMFYYEGIRKCKKFMLENPEFDLIGMDGAGADFRNNNLSYFPSYPEYINSYNKWKTEKTPFSFCDLGLMIRKSSLSYLGLFNPAYIRLDAEFTFRASSLPKTKIAWYTGCCYVRIANENSNSVKYGEFMDVEWEKLEWIYLKSNERYKTKKSIIQKLKEKIKRKIFLIGEKYKNKKLNIDNSNNMNNIEETQISWEEFCNKTDIWLKKNNSENSGKFYI